MTNTERNIRELMTAHCEKGTTQLVSIVASEHESSGETICEFFSDDGKGNGLRLFACSLNDLASFVGAKGNRQAWD